MRNLFITLSLLVTLSFLQAQNISYQIYDNGNLFSNEEKILNVFEVPKGNLFIVKNKDGVFFKLFNNEFKLIKTTPLTHDIADDKSITLSKVYKLKDKIIGEFWGGSVTFGGQVTQRKFKIFEYDLTGKFIKHIDMPELKANVDQNLYFSSDSSLILYWSTAYMMSSGYTQQVSSLPENERLISFKIYNSNFEELRSEDLLLNNLNIEKDQFLNIQDVKILNSGNINFCYLFKKKNGFPYEKNTCKLSVMNYDFESRKLKNYSINPIIAEKYNPLFYSIYDSTNFIGKYDDKYIIINTKDNSKTAKQISSNLTIYNAITYPNKNGNFIVESGVYDLNVCFIDNDSKLKDYELEKYSTNKYTLLHTSKFMINNRFSIFYIHQNKSTKKFDYYFAFFNEDGELTKKTLQLKEELSWDDLSNFYKISENKYITQLATLNKYAIITVNY